MKNPKKKPPTLEKKQNTRSVEDLVKVGKEGRNRGRTTANSLSKQKPYIELNNKSDSRNMNTQNMDSSEINPKSNPSNIGSTSIQLTDKEKPKKSIVSEQQ